KKSNEGQKGCIAGNVRERARGSHNELFPAEIRKHRWRIFGATYVSVEAAGRSSGDLDEAENCHRDCHNKVTPHQAKELVSRRNRIWHNKSDRRIQKIRL